MNLIDNQLERYANSDGTSYPTQVLVQTTEVVQLKVAEIEINLDLKSLFPS